MAESIKARPRHEAAGYFEKYFVGHGLDIGSGSDPVTSDCDIFEKPEPDNGKPPEGHTVFYGDAHVLESVERDSYDYIYASHILEHLEDPMWALRTWFQCLKRGGILFLSVPHRDYYERQRLLPSFWNHDHKTMWLPSEQDPPNTFSLASVAMDALRGFAWTWVEAPQSHVTASDKLLPAEEHAQGEYSIECILRKL